MFGEFGEVVVDVSRSGEGATSAGADDADGYVVELDDTRSAHAATGALGALEHDLGDIRRAFEQVNRDVSRLRRGIAELRRNVGRWRCPDTRSTPAAQPEPPPEQPAIAREATTVRAAACGGGVFSATPMADGIPTLWIADSIGVAHQ